MSAKRSLFAVVLAVFLVGVNPDRLGAAELSGVELPDQVTFCEHIAPLIFNNCYECHRSGEAAPFTLASYQDVSKRATMLQEVIGRRFMPPWHPAPGDVEFRNSRRLGDQQIALFDKWVATGKPEGDVTKLPELPSFADGWRLGKPDLTVTMSDFFPVPADGKDIYRNFVIPLDLPEDKWLTAIDIRPNERSVVHHVLYFADESGTARQRSGGDGQPGFRGMGFRAVQVGGWAVGGTPEQLPYGLARKLPAGSDLILACHFHPVGKAADVKITAALYFADKPPTRDFVRFQVPPGYGRGTKLSEGVPPGEKSFQISGRYTLPADGDLISLAGHAHYICTSMKATATLPDGTVLDLLSIPAWDFNWQGQYLLKESLHLPKGTVLYGEVNYDNSEDNLNNPNYPPKLIRWGLQSTDEMGSLFFGMAVDDATLFQNRGRARRDAAGGQLLARLKALDTNSDGKLQTSEVPANFRSLMGKIDNNSDGELDRAELTESADRLKRFFENIGRR